MKKLLAATILATTILLSPAYAQEAAPTEEQPKAVCTKNEDFIAYLAPRGFKLTNTLVGDSFATFARNAAADNKALPDGIDSILTFKAVTDDDHTMVVLFVKGCAVGVKVVPDRFLAKLIEDRSI